MGEKRPALREPHSTAITPSATVLLVGAVHAVCICIAAPAHGDAVPVLALELVEFAAWRAVFLQGKCKGQWLAETALAVAASRPVTAARTRLSAPRGGGRPPAEAYWVGYVPTPTRGQGKRAGREPLPSVPYLVRAICTVVVPITLPPASDAATVGTGELTL